MKTNEIYMKMLAYLLDNGKAKNYADIARRTGVSEVSISRARNGNVKSVKEDTLRKVNNAFGQVFNPDWMRGNSDIMLTVDLTPPEPEVSTTMHGYAPQATTQPDMSSMINAIIGANDQAIMSLKRELASKEDVIAELRARVADKERMASQQQDAVAELRARLADKDDIVAQKEETIRMLQQQLLDLRIEKGLSTGLPTHGVAEEPTRTVRPRV